MPRDTNVTCLTCKSRSTNVFCALDKFFTDSLDHLKHPRSYQKKQVLFYEGAPAVGLYCIRSGKVKVYKTSVDGHQYILHLSEPGQVLGLESLFTSNPYASTAEMIEEGTVCFIEKDAFLDFLRKDTRLCLKVMEVLAASLKESESERMDLAQCSVRERMARLLSLLSETHGTRCKEGIRITLALSREELAEMAGTAAETAMRLLKDFREAKVLTVRGREITITNQARLRRAGNLN